MHECEEAKDGSGYIYPGSPLANDVGFKLGKDAHTTHKDAAKTAGNARAKKITSIRKQLANLEKMGF